MKVGIIGVGVSGLSTGLLLRLFGFEVTIFTRSKENNPKDDLYVSDKAGAFWYSFASQNDVQMQHRDEVSYVVFSWMSEDSFNTGVMKLKGKIYYRHKSNYISFWWDKLANVKVIDEKDLHPSIEFGIQYEAYTINCPKYLDYLEKSFLSIGGDICFKAIPSIDDFNDKDYDVVINCSGLGSKFIKGIDDKALKPVAGAMLLIHPPKALFQQCYYEENPIYMIPREDHTVVIGGTFFVDTWDIDDEMTIKNNLISNISSIESKDLSNYLTQTFDSIPMTVGLRPFREEGIRLEMQRVHFNDDKNIQLIHNYGHGSHGYTSSWGCAYEVLEMAMLEKSQTSSTAVEKAKMLKSLWKHALGH